MEVTGSYLPFSIDHKPTLAVYGIGCSSEAMPYALRNNEVVAYLVICLAHVETYEIREKLWVIRVYWGKLGSAESVG